MEIRVNSRLRKLDCGMSVAELLRADGVPSAGTAVAVNGKIVRRTEWEARLVCEGDDIIIIQAAYGG